MSTPSKALHYNYKLLRFDLSASTITTGFKQAIYTCPAGVEAEAMLFSVGQQSFGNTDYSAILAKTYFDPWSNIWREDIHYHGGTNDASTKVDRTIGQLIVSGSFDYNAAGVLTVEKYLDESFDISTTTSFANNSINIKHFAEQRHIKFGQSIFLQFTGSKLNTEPLYVAVYIKETRRL